MGYYTEFDLSWESPTEKEYDAVWERIKGDPNFERAKSVLEEIASQKWYKHETELQQLSEAFPRTTFRLEGHGEEFPDLWVKWFKGGRARGSIIGLIYPDNPFKKKKAENRHD